MASATHTATESARELDCSYRLAECAVPADRRLVQSIYKKVLASYCGYNSWGPAQGNNGTWNERRPYSYQKVAVQ